MELVQVPEKSYGNFYEGDCYVLLFVSLGWWMDYYSFIGILPCYIGQYKKNQRFKIALFSSYSPELHTQFVHCCTSADAEAENCFELQHPLLDWLWVLAGRTGSSCSVHHPAWWLFRLLSGPVQRSSALRVRHFQGLLQTGNNVSKTKWCYFGKGQRSREEYRFVLFRYKTGGIATGMRHTETNTYNIERLLHVKGNKRVVAKEVSHVFVWHRGT